MCGRWCKRAGCSEMHGPVRDIEDLGVWRPPVNVNRPLAAGWSARQRAHRGQGYIEGESSDPSKFIAAPQSQIPPPPQPCTCYFLAHPATTMDRLAIRRLATLRGPFPTIARTARQPARPHSTAAQNVTNASFWKSLVPKPLRRENRVRAQKSSTRRNWLAKEWNPATFYIIIFLMIGSMSIQMISLRKNFEAFMRRSDVRIGLLREVVEKLQNGEQVDVEKVLGTGDTEREAEWEEGRFQPATTYGSD